MASESVEVTARGLYLSKQGILAVGGFVVLYMAVAVAIRSVGVPQGYIYASGVAVGLVSSDYMDAMLDWYKSEQSGESA